MFHHQGIKGKLFYIPLRVTMFIRRCWKSSSQCLMEQVTQLFQGLDAAGSYVFTVLLCGLVECAWCVCGNYRDLNAGSAGETGCLLINEWSRWPQVGGSCEHTARRSGGQHRTHTWAITNKTSQAVDTSQRHLACVCMCLSVSVFSLKVNNHIQCCACCHLTLLKMSCVFL